MKFTKMTNKQLDTIIIKATKVRQERIDKAVNLEKAQKAANQLLKDYGMAATRKIRI